MQTQRVYFKLETESNVGPIAVGTRDGFRLPNGDWVPGFTGDYYASENIDIANGYDVRGKTFEQLKRDNDAGAPNVYCVMCRDRPADTILEFELHDGWTYGGSNGPFYLCKRDATVSAEAVLARRGSPRLGNV